MSRKLFTLGEMYCSDCDIVMKEAEQCKSCGGNRLLVANNLPNPLKFRNQAHEQST